MTNFKLFAKKGTERSISELLYLVFQTAAEVLAQAAVMSSLREFNSEKQTPYLVHYCWREKVDFGSKIAKTHTRDQDSRKS